ncbi:TRAP transporter small permease [Tropicimonas sp. IMCC34011]|uniref:TRAP transporter small permease n=1 Tax=Tropicimonas sp. IMCC34011 TaxID=2248759 RepID=UPI0013002FD1|nr:TRAP transporter small permease [Tropicimonas sp. IMCC34011]
MYRIGGSIWTGLLKVQRLVMLVTIIVTSSAIMIEVVMRYVFQSSIIGIQELAAYTAIWLYFSGAAYGTYTRSHISAELTHLVLKNPRHLAVTKVVTNAISFGLAVYILPWAWRYIEWGYTRGEQSDSSFLGGTYPIYFFQASILYGLALMAFYFFIEMLQWLHPLITGRDVPKELATEREEIASWI